MRPAPVVLLLGLVFAAPAPCEQLLLLELVVNGRSTGVVGEFTERDGALYATPAELVGVGLLVPPAIAAAHAELVPLAALPGVTARLDVRTQQLVLTAPDAALRPNRLMVRGIDRDPVDPASPGAVLNYDVLGQRAAGRDSVTGLLEGRAFGLAGVLSSAMLANGGARGPLPATVRLDTTWSWADADELHRLRGGDVISSGLGWTRPLRLGGVQAGSDFTLRPDLVTFPTPVVRGSVAVASTVDLFVNGVRQFSSPVEQGPFELRQLPVLTGAGEVAVVVRDALGRERVELLPFYASRALLAEGLTDWSLQAGAVRQRYGQASDDYADGAAIATLRHGLDDAVTLEGHGEAGAGVTMGGGGAVVRLGQFGTLGVSGARSDGRTALGEPARGRLLALSYERAGQPVSLSAGLTRASHRFTDVVASLDGARQVSTLRLAAGLGLGALGSVSVGYVAQRFSTVRAETVGTRLRAAFGNAELLTASWSLPLGDGVHAYTTGFADLERRGSVGILLGLVLLLGPQASVSAQADHNRSGTGASAQWQRNAAGPEDWSARLQAGGALAGERPGRVGGEAAWQAGWGRVSAGAERAGEEDALRLGLRGALATLGGGVFLADRVDDAFAVVSTGVPDMPVRYENRPAGRTGPDGLLMVPTLRAWQPNSLALDPEAVPLDADPKTLRRRVVPPDRAGVLVDFAIRRGSAAMIRLRDAAGRPIPLGSDLAIRGQRLPIGHDGETFVGGLEATNEGVVTLKEGGRCRVAFPFRPVPDELPVIEATCR